MGSNLVDYKGDLIESNKNVLDDIIRMFVVHHHDHLHHCHHGQCHLSALLPVLLGLLHSDNLSTIKVHHSSHLVIIDIKSINQNG